MFAQLAGFPRYLFSALDKLKSFYVRIPSLCFQLIQADQMGLIWVRHEWKGRKWRAALASVAAYEFSRANASEGGLKVAQWWRPALGMGSGGTLTSAVSVAKLGGWCSVGGIHL